ncbi:tkr-3 (predicted) [Pycnogonum litorale]
MSMLNNTFNVTNATDYNRSSYYNDGDDSGLYSIPPVGIAALSLLYGGVSVLAVAGNGCIIIIVATSRRMHSVTNYFIANLAVSDIVIGLFAIPIHLQAALLRRWHLPEFMCPLFPFAEDLSVNVSIFTLSAIALDRYRAIMYPLEGRMSKKKAKIIMCAIWILATGFSLPYAVTYRVTTFQNIVTGERKRFCFNAVIPRMVWKIYANLLVTVQYLIPSVILCSAYTKMALQLWGSSVPGNAQGLRDAILIRNKKKVIKMLFTVLVLFSLCWIPYQTFNIVKALHPPIARYDNR